MSQDPRSWIQTLRRAVRTPSDEGARLEALDLLSHFVDQVLCERDGLLLTLERATRELEGKVGELSLLRRLADVFAQDFQDRDLPRHVLEVLQDEQGAEDAALWIADGADLNWRAGVGRGEQPGQGVGGLDCISMGEGLIGQIAMRQEALVVNDALLESRCRDADPFFKQGSFSLFPLLSTGRLAGVLWIGSPERFAFPAERMRILSLAAGQIAQGLSGAELCLKHVRFSENLSEVVADYTHSLEEKSNELVRYQATWAGFFERLQLGATPSELEPLPSSERLGSAVHSLKALAAARSEWRATLATAAQQVQTFRDDYERYLSSAAALTVPLVDSSEDAEAA